MNETSDRTRRELWKQIYNNFKSKFEDWNSLYTHQSLKGDQNEKNLISLLKDFLPGKYDLFSKAQILDQEGNISKEQDIIIWDKMNQPRIFSQGKFFIIENVHATIEVKTKLDKKSLKEAIMNIFNLRKMKYFKRLDGDPRWQIHPPLSFIFAYDMTWKNKGSLINIIEEICKNNNIKADERFDYLYVMNRGLEVCWDIPIDPNFTGLLDVKKHYKDICPINERWPQFFPSKLIKNIPIILRETRIYEKGSIKPEDYNEVYLELSIENQIRAIIRFLKILCQALEDQRIFYSYNNVSLSFTPSRITSHPTKRTNPF